MQMSDDVSRLRENEIDSTSSNVNASTTPWAAVFIILLCYRVIHSMNICPMRASRTAMYRER